MQKQGGKERAWESFLAILVLYAPLVCRICHLVVFTMRS